MSRFLKKASALTLVEVIVSMLIFSIFVAAMFTALEHAKRFGNRYKCKSHATSASRELLERLLTLDPDGGDFSIGDHTDTDGPINLPTGHFLEGYPRNGNRKYIVSYHANGYKIIDVKVYWEPFK